MEHNILSVSDRRQFRAWLFLPVDDESECWVEVKRGKPTDPETFYYIDAVEEALCFGWIDSTNQLINGTRYQRFTPRKKNSPWTELNKERVRAYNAAFYKKRNPIMYKKTLDHLISETKKGKMFGAWNDYGRLLDY